LKNNAFIPILNFENQIDDELLLQGEKLFDELKLNNLLEITSGKWEALVEDGDKLHVKASITNQRILESSCSCQNNSTKDMCVHQVCLYFGIRSAEDNNSIQVKPAYIPKVRTANYLKDILENISNEELKTFVSSYSSKDKQFKLLMTTHFSRILHDRSGPKLYERILDESFPVKTENSNRSYVSETRLLIKIGKEILQNYLDALSLEAYKEAFHMISAFLNKTAYALFINTKENKTLDSLYERTHTSYKSLINDRLAPALKYEMISSMIESLGKSFYKYQGPDNLYQLILMSSPTLEQIQALQIKLIDKEKNIRDLSESSFLIAHILYTNFHLKNIKDPAAYFSLFKGDQILISETLKKMLSLGFKKEAEFTLESLKKHDQLDDSAYQRIKLNIQMKKGESSQAIETAFSLFKSTKDYQYVMKIKSLSQSDWQKNYQKIMDILHSSMNARGFELALKMAGKKNEDKKN